MKLKRRTLGLYLIWVGIHLTLFILPKDGFEFDQHYKEFWPFSGNSWDQTYDLSEFLIYSLAPLIILYALNLIRHEKD
jgi:hypothetical protein